MITMEIIRSFQCRLLPKSKGDMSKRYAYAAIQYLPQGCVELQIAGRRQVLRGPGIWFCYPGAQYRLRWRETHERWFVGMWGTPIDRWLAQGLFQRRYQSIQDTNAVEQRIQLLTELNVSRSVNDRRRATLLVEEFLVYLLNERGAAIQHNDIVQDVYELISADIINEPDPKQIAAQYGMGESTLRRRFRQEIGLPIHQAWMQERMAVAGRLLIETQDDISSIAKACGFTDPAYFSRCFKQRNGSSPQAFRRLSE